MANFTSYGVLAVLACSVAIATYLKFNPDTIKTVLGEEAKDLMKLIMKPHIPSRYIPEEAFLKMGMSPATRVTSYHWKPCKNVTNQNIIVHNITFGPDPLHFPGPLNVAFDISVKISSSENVKADLTIEKRVGNVWVRVPCEGFIGSCSYDLCFVLNLLPSCPDVFVKAGLNCKCPFKMGRYTVKNANFLVNSEFLSSGDYHFRTNVTDQKEWGGCYDLYVTFD